MSLRAAESGFLQHPLQVVERIHIPARCSRQHVQDERCSPRRRHAVFVRHELQDSHAAARPSAAATFRKRWRRRPALGSAVGHAGNSSRARRRSRNRSPRLERVADERAMAAADAHRFRAFAVASRRGTCVNRPRQPPCRGIPLREHDAGYPHGRPRYPGCGDGARSRSPGCRRYSRVGHHHRHHRAREISPDRMIIGHRVRILFTRAQPRRTVSASRWSKFFGISEMSEFQRSQGDTRATTSTRKNVRWFGVRP